MTQGQGRLPEFYGDGWAIQVTDYSVMIIVGDTPQPGQLVAKAAVRIPTVRAKELALYLRSVIKKAERESGRELPVSGELMAKWGIAPEDW